MADVSDQEASSPAVAATPSPQYYLAGGVRRAVAAREAGLRDIAAKANADVFLTVRGLYDQEKQKAKVLGTRKSGSWSSRSAGAWGTA